MGQAMKNTPKKRKEVDQLVFRETLAQTMPYAPATNVLTPYQLRSMVVVVWALAAIALGVGVGLLLTPKPAQQAVTAPTQVQTADLSMAKPSTAAIIDTAPVSAVLSGTVTPVQVTQAQAGEPVQTVSSNFLQPTAVPTAYVTGYSAYQNLQGNIGTTPVN